MLLLDASEEDGMRWSQRAKCSIDDDFCATIVRQLPVLIFYSSFFLLNFNL